MGEKGSKPARCFLTERFRSSVNQGDIVLMSAEKLKGKFRWPDGSPEHAERSLVEGKLNDLAKLSDGNLPIGAISLSPDGHIIVTWIDVALDYFGKTGKLDSLAEILSSESESMKESQRKYRN